MINNSKITYKYIHQSMKKRVTCEEGRQRVPISRLGRESWKPGCGSTTPCNSTIPHSSQLASPQLHRTRICISLRLRLSLLEASRCIHVFISDAFCFGAKRLCFSRAISYSFSNFLLTTQGVNIIFLILSVNINYTHSIIFYL